MSKFKQVARAHVSIRPGEGFPVDVTRSAIGPEGRTDISLDMSSVPVPERSYWADTAAVASEDEVVRMMFGQRQVVGGRLRSLLVVTMTAENAKRFLESCSEFAPGTAKFMAEAGIEKAKPMEIAEEPSQTLALVASLASVARTGAESSLDFYYLSPRMLADFTRRSLDKVGVEPVVRITMRTAVLAMAIDTLDNLLGGRETASG